MIKIVVLATGFLIATMPFQARAQVSGGSFDVLASVVETNQREINANDVLDSNRKEAERYREKVIAGWWEFMQASSKAGRASIVRRPSCAPSACPEPGKVDKMKEGIVVTLFGPGGTTAVPFGFSPWAKTPPRHSRKLAKGSPSESPAAGQHRPVTLNAIYGDRRGKSPPLLCSPCRAAS